MGYYLSTEARMREKHLDGMSRLPLPPNPGEVIRRGRQRKGLTVSSLARDAGITSLHLEKIESGACSVTRYTFNRIMQHLGTE